MKKEKCFFKCVIFADSERMLLPSEERLRVKLGVTIILALE